MRQFWYCFIRVRVNTTSLSQVICSLFLPPLLFWLVSFRDDAWDDIGSSRCEKLRDGGTEVSRRFSHHNHSYDLSHDLPYFSYIHTYNWLLENVFFLSNEDPTTKFEILFQTKSDTPALHNVNKTIDIAYTRLLSHHYALFSLWCSLSSLRTLCHIWSYLAMVKNPLTLVNSGVQIRIILDERWTTGIRPSCVYKSNRSEQFFLSYVHGQTDRQTYPNYCKTTVTSLVRSHLTGPRMMPTNVK